MWKMRTLCDVCEAAPAQLFCAADEAALCIKCDEKVHGCNKLANRHVRLQLGEARAVPKCDICESAPAFFFCGIDGTSLCLQCDMDVHIGGKKTHERYLMMGQRVELPARQFNTEDPMGEGNDQGKYHQGYINGTRSLEWNNSDAPAVAIAQNASSREPSSSDDECAGVVPEIIITDVKDENMTNCES